MARELRENVGDAKVLDELVDDSEELPGTDDDSEELPETVYDSEELPETVDDSEELPETVDDSEELPEETDDDSEELPEEWTKWIAIIKPKITPEEHSKGWIRKRENWHTKSAVLQQFDGTSDIYELRLHKGRNKCVVYIGSSCAKGGLRYRLSQYATNGSHKALLIQKALSARVTIEARACTLKDCETARARENEILAKYDYLWNRRRNMTLRKAEAFATALYGITPEVYQ